MKRERQVQARILALVALSNLLAAFNWLNYSPLIVPIMDEFKITNATAGLLVSSSAILAVFVIFPSGWLADKYSPRRLMTVFILLLFLSAILTGLSQDYEQLFVARFFTGFAVAIFPIGTKMLTDWFSLKRMGLVQGIFGGSFGGGVSLAALVMPLAADFTGWRFAFIVAALPLLPLAASMWFLANEKPFYHRAHPDYSSSRPKMKLSQTWFFTLLNVTFFGTAVSIMIWLPTYFLRIYNLPLVTAGTIVAASTSLAVVARPIGGLLSDRYNKKLIMTGSAAILVLIYSILGDTNIFFLGIISAILIGWFNAFGAGALFSLPPVLFPKRVGAIVGLASAIALLIGVVILPPIVGFLLDTTGSFGPGFSILALIAAAGTIGSLCIARKSSE